MIMALLLAAAPVSIVSKTADLEFTYRWPREAEAVPKLRTTLRDDAAKQQASMRKMAAAERAWREKEKLGWHGLMFERVWTAAGQSPRLLSLRSKTANYTGGAHGNSFTRRLLWDRRLGREVSIGSLLRSGESWKGAIQQPFCVLLERERRKRVGDLSQTGNWPCPSHEQLATVLVDRDRNGRFDHVEITADPYAAGSYAEGEYIISLPLTATMLARLKPEYRASFEPQPPVQ